jgi:hypothetical protein
MSPDDPSADTVRRGRSQTAGRAQIGPLRVRKGEAARLCWLIIGGGFAGLGQRSISPVRQLGRAGSFAFIAACRHHRQSHWPAADVKKEVMGKLARISALLQPGAN